MPELAAAAPLTVLADESLEYRDVTQVTRAATLVVFGAELRIDELPVPEPEPGAIVVAVDATTICASDVHIWEGRLSNILPDDALPIILGHETVGRIERIGAGPQCDSLGTPIRHGDRIAWTHEACGHCHVCSSLRMPMVCPNRRATMFAGVRDAPHITGGFAEHQYVWERAQRIRVPDELPSAVAAAASCAGRTAMAAVAAAGRLAATDSVVIQGAGPVGLFATAMASVQCPADVIVIDGSPERLELARGFGATETILLTHRDGVPVEAVQELTSGQGASVVFEMTGVPDALVDGLACAGIGATYILTGVVGPGDVVIAPYMITNRRLTVQGIFSSDIGDLHETFTFMARHARRFDWDALVSREYPLERATDALRAMRDRREIKPVVRPARVSAREERKSE